jgi:histone H3/H4
LIAVRIIGGVERNTVGSSFLTSEYLFRRVVRQVCYDLGCPHLRIDKYAFQAMQEAAEFFLIREFKCEMAPA